MKQDQDEWLREHERLIGAVVREHLRPRGYNNYAAARCELMAHARLLVRPAATESANIAEERRKARQTGYLEGMSAGTARDLAALLRRGSTLLNAWAVAYGEHQPEWLPPAGCVRWAEDVQEALAGPDRDEPAATVRTLSDEQIHIVSRVLVQQGCQRYPLLLTNPGK